MIKIIAEDSSLQDIHINDITRYLEKTGWKRREYPDKRLIMFDGPNDDKGKPIILALPENKEFLDSRELIANAINLLVAIERTTPQRILQKIRSLNRDTICVHILLSSGSVPSLDASAHMIHGLRNLVAYSACMEREPRRYFEHPFKEGKQQTQHFLFGHTFPGSFGFTIESPIEDFQRSISGFASYSDLPLARRVIERITRGFLFVQEAVKTQDSAKISINYERGLNANMCSAILDMFKGLQETEIEFSVTWSSWLEPWDDIAGISSIRLQGNISPYLEEAAQYLEEIYRAQEGNVIEDSTVQGEIQELVSKNQTNRAIIVLSERHGRIRFSIGSESEWDKMACNAYRDRRSISIRGTLIRKKRGPWTLVNPRDLKVE